jgi:hypothetical protein
MQQTVKLTDAALMLRTSHQKTLALVLAGELTGRRVDGRWVVDLASVREYQRTQGLGVAR